MDDTGEQTRRRAQGRNTPVEGEVSEKDSWKWPWDRRGEDKGHGKPSRTVIDGDEESRHERD